MSKEEKPHGPGQQCGDGVGGVSGGEEGIEEINAFGKYIIKYNKNK